MATRRKGEAISQPKKTFVIRKLTAAQIRKDLGISKEDQALVDRVLTRAAPKKRTVSGVKKPAKKLSAGKNTGRLVVELDGRS